MVKLITGGKGTGKSKRMIAMANELIKTGKGHVVFINDDKRPMYDLKYEMRFVSMDEYPINDPKGFHGFLCGMISSDHDIEAIFVDGLPNIIKVNDKTPVDFLKEINMLSQKFEIDFITSLNCVESDIPEELKDYITVL